MGKVALLGLAWALGLHAAVIRGTVLERSSGHPIAESLVVAEPVEGTHAAIQSARSNADGQFEFAALPAGAYLVLASHRGFAPAQYGQKRYKGSGVPVVLEESDTARVEIRLQRFGSISGTVLDENGVGLADHEVVAYRNSRPPVLVAQTITDDLGAYRLWGLEPGSYLVRTLGKEYAEGRYLPTFARETERLEEAYATQIELDTEAEHVDVRPLAGRLFTVAGRVSAAPQSPVMVTLISEMGSTMATADARGNFQFPPAAAGRYELYAVQDGGRVYRGAMAAYLPIVIDRDRSDFRLNLAAIPTLSVETVDEKGQALDPGGMQIWIRRKDFSGQGKALLFRGPQALAPGRWELALAPNTQYYTLAFSGPGAVGGGEGRADGWHEIELAASATAQFTVAAHPGTIHGAVQDSGKPVAGAPVFLEAYDVASRRRVGELRSARTDVHGRYAFYGLAPGDYRLLGSFEFQMPEEAEMNEARTMVVKVAGGQDQAVDLDLYTIR